MPSKALITWPGVPCYFCEKEHIRAGLIWYMLPFRACINLFSPNNVSRHLSSFPKHLKTSMKS